MEDPQAAINHLTQHLTPKYILLHSLFHTYLPSHSQMADAHITRSHMSIEMITPAMELPLGML